MELNPHIPKPEPPKEEEKKEEEEKKDNKEEEKKEEDKEKVRERKNEMCKVFYVPPVYGTGIRTHDLSHMSRHR